MVESEVVRVWEEDGMTLYLYRDGCVRAEDAETGEDLGFGCPDEPIDPPELDW